MADNEVLLDVKGLKVYYPLFKGVFKRKWADVKAVDGIDFFIRKGETLGLVGESGCGKTSTARCVLQLQRPTAGDIFFKGVDLVKLQGEQLRLMRRNMQIIFQDPYTSLNPLLLVGDIICEPLLVHKVMTNSSQLKAEVARLLRLVRLEPYMASRYPHEFSGGQRQRIAIARALALRPELVFCDEPVSALDVSTQVQITDLLLELQQQFGLTYLFISHDLSVVRYISDRVAVMYLGKMVELGDATQICERPAHPYSQALLSAVPLPDPFKERVRQRIVLEGEVPSALNPPPGCRFHPRCQYRIPGRCDVEEPLVKKLEDGRFINCHLFN